MARIVRYSSVHVILIALAGLIVYSNTFRVPFQWDESFFVVQSPMVKDLSFFVEPSKAKPLVSVLEYKTFVSRYLGYLTFALNYRFHGYDLSGYHLVNLVIHVLNSLLVYVLVEYSFRTPYLTASSLKEYSRRIAFFSALLFAVHPVQTEAVTYIWQRPTELATGFYVFSLILYARWRSTIGRRRKMLYFVALLSAVFAMRSKEMAVTLPFSLTLYELMFFPPPGKRTTRVFYLSPFFLVSLLVPLGHIQDFSHGLSGALSDASQGNPDISRRTYFATQLRVLVTYLRLIFFPVNQTIDYDYPIYDSFFVPQVFLSLTLLLLVLSLGIYLFVRYKSDAPHVRLISYSIFWFFITLSVESSVIQLRDMVSEHRLYLPTVGVFTAISVGGLLCYKRLPKRFRPILIAGFVSVTLVFAVATYKRNTIWSSGISLWSDVVKKSPMNARGQHNLGIAYMSEGMPEKAIEHYRMAIKMQPQNAEAHNHLGEALKELGRLDEAVKELEVAVRQAPIYVEAHNNIGIVFAEKGDYDMAISHFAYAIALRPIYVDAHYHLALAYSFKGWDEKASEEYKIALKLDPNHASARNNLSVLQRNMSRSQ